MDDEQLRRTVATRITGHIEGAVVSVAGGGGKFEATVVSERFDGLDAVSRHRLVYAAVKQEIESGAVHALSIRARTPQEEQS